MKTERIKIFFALVAVIWIVHVLDWIIPYNLKMFGIIPRTTRGLIGIVTSPFLHGSIFHLIGNTVPLIVLGMLLVSFYERLAFPVMGFIVIIGGGLVWVLGRQANHIGASGVIYGMAGFLIAYGILKKNVVSILVAGGVIFLYGGSMIGGLLPFNAFVSWEGHLFGAIAGILAAFIYSKQTAAGEAS
jgi:membrane associated rhomboid family serine protease